MNTAPTVEFIPRMCVQPSLRFNVPTGLHLADVRTGQPFVLASDNSTLYALLHHQQVDVRDAAKRWCVVLDTNAPGAHAPGELVCFPADTLVYLVRMEQRARYAVA